MTIDTIRNKILEKTGIDCYSKLSVKPISDVKKIFYRACLDFARDKNGNFYSVNKLSKILNIHHTTILYHLSIPISVYINLNIKTQQAHDIFYPSYKENLECKINQLKKENKKLQEKIKELESRPPKTIIEYR